MSCHTSPLLDQTVDTDSESSLNEYLNGLTSSSSEERIDQLDHGFVESPMNKKLYQLFAFGQQRRVSLYGLSNLL